MSERAKDLAERLEAFNRDMMTFVEHLTEAEWRKICAWEDWGWVLPRATSARGTTRGPSG